MASDRNILEARADLLGQTVKRRAELTMRKMTEPKPPFMVEMSEIDQVRRYLSDRDSGNLKKMRESEGGPYRDEDVDRYVAWGERMTVKHAPKLILQEHTDKSGELHPGLQRILDQRQQGQRQPQEEME